MARRKPGQFSLSAKNQCGGFDRGKDHLSLPTENLESVKHSVFSFATERGKGDQKWKRFWTKRGVERSLPFALQKRGWAAKKGGRKGVKAGKKNPISLNQILQKTVETGGKKIQDSLIAETHTIETISHHLLSVGVTLPEGGCRPIPEPNLSTQTFCRLYKKSQPNQGATAQIGGICPMCGK